MASALRYIASKSEGRRVRRFRAPKHALPRAFLFGRHGFVGRGSGRRRGSDGRNSKFPSGSGRGAWGVQREIRGGADEQDARSRRAPERMGASRCLHGDALDRHSMQQMADGAGSCRGKRTVVMDDLGFQGGEEEGAAGQQGRQNQEPASSTRVHHSLVLVLNTIGTNSRHRNRNRGRTRTRISLGSPASSASPGRLYPPRRSRPSQGHAAACPCRRAYLRGAGCGNLERKCEWGKDL